MSLIQKVSASSADEAILDCVDAGLDKVGPNVKKYVYSYLLKLAHVDRRDIPSNPESFAKGLRSLYAESAICVEKAMVQEINARFGLHFSQAQLVDAISEARQKVKPQ